MMQMQLMKLDRFFTISFEDEAINSEYKIEKIYEWKWRKRIKVDCAFLCLSNTGDDYSMNDFH